MVYQNHFLSVRSELRKQNMTFHTPPGSTYQYYTYKGSLSGVTPRIASNFGKR